MAWLNFRKPFTIEFSAAKLEKDMFAADFQEVKELKLPVYFFIGRRFNNIPATLVEEFAKKPKSAKKGSDLV